MVLLGCLVILVFVMTLAAFFVWAERKISARIQDRLGPTRVGGRFGWLQSVADGLKLLTKEDIIPAAADRVLFRIAPYLGFAAVFLLFLALPFSDGWVAQRLNVGLFFLLAVASLEVYAVLLGGYASGSKWSLLGGMREAVQVVSYEIPLGLCAVIPVLLAGTMDLVTLANVQAGMFWNWFLFHNQFSFIAFWVFLTCATASINRAPFDLPEAESELVAGFMTEYSGFRWSVFMLGEYVAMFAVGGLAAILFLGGWHGPIPLAGWLGLSAENGFWASVIGQFAGAVNFVLKGILIAVAIIWARWSLPRLRIDQVMTMCLKYCLPIAAAAFIGSLFWKAAFPAGVLGIDVARFFVPEGWMIMSH